MNIFFLDKSPRIAAMSLCDVHVIKMLLESTQMLCTAYHVLLSTAESWLKKHGERMDKIDMFASIRKQIPYKSAFANHPCSIWTRQCSANYLWLLKHAEALVREYAIRYDGKIHACSSVLQFCKDQIPFLLYAGLHNIEIDVDWAKVPQCMPEYCKVPNDPIRAYRNYYSVVKAEELPRFTYTNVKPPEWLGFTPQQAGHL